MAAIVKRAFIFTPAFLQENDRIQSSCRIFSAGGEFGFYGTLKMMSVSK
jgi:hypothetical protein